MPRTPKSWKRPTDVIGNAVHIMKVATGEIDGDPAPQKDQAAVALGRKGGTARAAALSQGRKTAIARKAAQTRWAKQK